MAKVLDGQLRNLIQHYLQARTWIRSSPFARELEWQTSLRSSHITESQFLCEYSWVVLNSGFRESVVRKHFDYISLCYCDWESAAAITRLGPVCVECALSVFGNRRKLQALLYTARLVDQRGFDWLRVQLEADDFAVLQTLPFIGQVTKRHLAKNLGLNVAKPDRHLVRLAERFGYATVHGMCEDVSKYCGDSISVADLVLWRFEERVHSR
jgi:hypothetical protein